MTKGRTMKRKGLGFLLIKRGEAPLLMDRNTRLIRLRPFKDTGAAFAAVKRERASYNMRYEVFALRKVRAS